MKIIRSVFLILFILSISIQVYAKKIAKLQLYKGNVKVKLNSSEKWIKPKINLKLDERDIIKTASKSSAKIKFVSGDVYEIPAGKTIKVKDIAKLIKSKRAGKGTTLSRLRSLKQRLGKGGLGSGGPTAVAGVRGADVSEKSKSPVKPSDLVWEE